MTAMAGALDALPKVELHCHIEGAMRPSTVVELARSNGIPLPTEDPTERVDAELGGVHSNPDNALGPTGTGSPERREFLDEVSAGRGPEGTVHVTNEQAG